MRRKYALAIAIGMLLAPGLIALARGAEGDDYAAPTLLVPYCRAKPTIDGAVGDAEWQSATSVNALQTTGHQVSPRQSCMWIMWDEDNLYMAMRSPLRKGERVIQARRTRERDVNVVFDDSYEIWLDVGAVSKEGLDCFVQFLCNYAGARYDVLHLPSVGNSRLGYTSGWAPVNRISPDNAWEWELVIPRESIYMDKPFSDGFGMTILLARNYKRPWEQNSFEGSSTFAVRESHTRVILSKDAPAVHLLGVADPVKQTLGLDLAVYGHSDGKLKWSFESDEGVSKEGEIAVKEGALTRGGPGLAVDAPGKGNYRIRVLSADGRRTHLDWRARRQFGKLDVLTQEINDPGDKVGLTLALNPVKNYVRVTGDFIQYDDRGKIDRCRVIVSDAAGKALAEKDMKIDELSYVRDVVHLGDIPFGEYGAELICMDADGKTVLERESKVVKKDHTRFPWWNTKWGDIEKVIAPWTPVTWNRGRPRVYGRTMAIGAAGLPKRVTSQGADILAAGSTLVAEFMDGKTRTLKRSSPKLISREEHRLIARTRTGKIGPLRVESEVTVEFDGMYKVDMTLDPGKAAVRVKSLKAVMPLKDEFAEYVHAVGEGIRYGFYYGFLPRDGKGRIWDCYTVDSQPMVVGSFIPYLWVGSTKGGLAWFADSDEGWAPDDGVPAIELRRDKPGRTDLVLNLISSELTINRPRTITFAFQATPVKPMHEKWRMDSWWCGDTFYDYPSSGSTIWLAIPYCRDIPKCIKMVEGRHKGTNGYIFGINKYRANAVPYFIHQNLPPNLVPEVRYFGDQWRTSISECLYYGETLTDYMIHNLGEWCRATGIDGYYIDNMRPVACDNIEAGRGYRLPDGRIQPSYQMFDTRRYFLRMRAAFAENGKHNKIVLHMTNCMIIPWVGAADVAYDGEHHVIYPEMKKDFMDFWSLERLRVDYSGQWGCAVNFMHEYQGRWDRTALLKAMRAYTGSVILHDALPSGNANAMNQPVWIGRDRFGIEADDVRFIGYWEPESGVTVAGKDVYVSAWARPGKVLLAVVNRGEAQDAVVRIDPGRLDLPAPGEWKVSDAEAGCRLRGHAGSPGWNADGEGPISHDGKGALTVPVKRHDYRQVIIERNALGNE